MIAGILLLIAAVVVGYAALAIVSAARASRRWPTVPGRVVRSEVRENRPFIRYQYAMEGEEHEGRDVTWGGWPYPTARTAASRVRRYPAGAQVAVHYDPGHPTTIAILEPGFSLEVLYLPAVASALLVAAFVLLSWSIWHLVSGQ
jgi:hypothetical protein